MPRAAVAKGPVSKTRVKAEPVSSHHDERVATALSRNALQRERFEFLLRTLFALFIILFLSVSANIYFGLQTTQYRYFATDPEGKITEVVPLERPIQSTTEVLNWATDAVVRSFTLSFANYQQQLADNRNLFTEPGWNGFEEALQRNRILDAIIKQQLVTTVVPSGAPVMVSQGIVEGGRYGWKLQVPLVITYESASGKNSQSLNVETIIVRRPESESPRGLGIGQIIAR
jgi:Macrophage killing protein with similarity to conjugation protein.